MSGSDPSVNDAAISNPTLFQTAPFRRAAVTREGETAPRANVSSAIIRHDLTESVQAFGRSGVQAFRSGKDKPALGLVDPERLNARTPERLNARTPECLSA
jgi:hypothetical protein